ncbi:hypothetical protein TanjilG_18683 [Lupinus angustifolius]|uniref:50S ribosomal protein L14, chloroplastic n=1 Tax=Lupinus angustifolius TaxID=3871 RepID=A0A1J7HAB7_LUPAN|nr:hypothetical protein TanjilG_18683 [Lupinus angustifolius]
MEYGRIPRYGHSGSPSEDESHKILARAGEASMVDERDEQNRESTGWGSTRLFEQLESEVPNGARELTGIRIIGASNRRYAYIGDIVVVVIKEVVPNTPLERSEVIIAIIVRICKELKHINSMIIYYNDNDVVVIDQEENPKGTQIFGTIVRELRQLNFTKIVSLAPEVL